MNDDYKKIFNQIKNPEYEQVKERNQKIIYRNKKTQTARETSEIAENNYKSSVNSNFVISGYNIDNDGDYQKIEVKVDSEKAMQRIRRATNADIIETNEDKVNIALTKYKEKVGKKLEYSEKIKSSISQIFNTLINIIGLWLIIFSADYNEKTLFSSTITPEQWEIAFIMIIIFYIGYGIYKFVMLLIFVVLWCRTKEIMTDEFINLLVPE